MESAPAFPPDDPEDWSDEQWLEWLQATDREAAVAPSRPVSRASRVAHSSAGGTIGAAMVGLHRAIYGVKDDEIAIVADAGGDPPGPQDLDVYLDPDDPAASTATLHRRPDGTEGEPAP